jgi:hypothetical protein
MKKLKFRQFYSARALWGSLSEENKVFNTPPGEIFPIPDTRRKNIPRSWAGVDNILKFFRVDFVWRISPTPLPPEKSKRFGRYSVVSGWRF